VFLCYLIVIVIFEKNLDKVNDYSKLYNMTSSESIEYQSMFDILREYFFDYKGYTGKLSFNDIITSDLLKIYETQKDKEELFSFDKLPSKFKNKYLEVTSSDLCYHAEQLFLKNNNSNYNYIVDNKYQCDNLTESNARYGLNLLISYYLVELRTQKNYFDRLIDAANEKNYTYNNTIVGTVFTNIDNGDNSTTNGSFNETEYEEYDPFKIFNDEHVFQLSMIRRYFLLPIYNDTLNEFYKSINNFWGTSYDIFLAIMVVLLLLITGFYLAYWIPSIYSIDEDIYKTKNMLSIIPKDVLSTIPGINKLLNLGNVTVFSGSWNKNDKKNKNAKKNNNKP